MTLDEAKDHVGSGVVYRPHERAKPEDGVITRIHGDIVFVLYRGDLTPKATRPQDLELARIA